MSEPAAEKPCLKMVSSQPDTTEREWECGGLPSPSKKIHGFYGPTHVSSATAGIAVVSGGIRLEQVNEKRLPFKFKDGYFTNSPQHKTRLSSNGSPDMAGNDNVSRYEMEAKLEAIEARMDTRVQRIETMIEKVLTSNEKIDARLNGLKRFGIGLAISLFAAIFAVFSVVTVTTSSWTQHSVTRLEPVY